MRWSIVRGELDSTAVEGGVRGWIAADGGLRLAVGHGGGVRREGGVESDSSRQGRADTRRTKAMGKQILMGAAAS